MAKKALIILAEGFEEIEAVTSIDILRRSGIQVTVAGLREIQIQGSHGITLTTDKKFDAIDEEFDAYVLPGGMPGAANLASSEKLISTLKRMNEAGKIIAAICAAPAVVLAPAGILKNKTATCFPDMREKFPKDAVYKQDSVVVNGNIITSRGPATALLFALEIAEKLSGKNTRQKVAKDVLIE